MPEVGGAVGLFYKVATKNALIFFVCIQLFMSQIEPGFTSYIHLYKILLKNQRIHIFVPSLITVWRLLFLRRSEEEDEGGNNFSTFFAPTNMGKRKKKEMMMMTSREKAEEKKKRQKNGFSHGKRTQEYFFT